MQSTGTRLLLLVFGVGLVLLAIVGVESLAASASTPDLMCGVGTHRVAVRTPTYDYLPDECRPNR